MNFEQFCLYEPCKFGMEDYLFSAGPQYNDDGDVIISEEEFLEIKRLRELKTNYKRDFDELKNLKAEVQYCQRLVDQCRQRLLQGKLICVNRGFCMLQ